MTVTAFASAPTAPTSPEFSHLRAFVGELVDHGLAEVCIAPGARSTPLTVSLTRQPRLRCWSHVDERSAAFFALGIARATRRPTAVVCTSGTAAANLFPAIVEAAHACVPLVILTADRPPELRDCEAGQAIDQIKMYGGYVKWFAEAGMADAGETYFRTLARRAWREANDVPAGVVHINVPLREPLIAGTETCAPPPFDSAQDKPVPRLGKEGEVRPSVPLLTKEELGEVSPAATATTVVYAGAPTPQTADVERLAARIGRTPRGLILCGDADRDSGEARAIAALAARIGYPILADPTSQMRRAEHGAAIGSYDAIVADPQYLAALTPDFVLRFGAPPICKPLRQWLQRLAVPQVVIDPRGRWNDSIGTAVEMWRSDPAATCTALLAAFSGSADPAWLRAWNRAEGRARTMKQGFLYDVNELSGPGLFMRLAEALPAGATLYVGNSLPIRQFEAAWPARGPEVRVLCNRGANGIDGMVSSVLGAAAVSDAPVVGVLGDLSFYHDLNGLLAARRRRIAATLIVLNNDGGGIFSILPQSGLGAVFDEYFTTPHGLDFAHAARLYGCDFERVQSWKQFDAALQCALANPETNIIEVPIDRDRDIEITRRLIALPGEASAFAVSPPATSTS